MIVRPTTRLYVHVPFCRAKCAYCAFYSEVLPAPVRVAQYLHALPELQVLQTQLHRVVQLARERQATLEWPDNKEKT